MDIIATIFVLETNLAREVNLLPAVLYGASPMLFSVVKSIAVSFVAYYIYRDKDRRARRTLVLLALFYIAITCYYLIVFPMLRLLANS